MGVRVFDSISTDPIEVDHFYLILSWRIHREMIFIYIAMCLMVHVHICEQNIHFSVVESNEKIKLDLSIRIDVRVCVSSI